MNADFRIEKSDCGYRVELYREGKPYVTFLDGLSKGGAEREAYRLTVLWNKLRAGQRSRQQPDVSR